MLRCTAQLRKLLRQQAAPHVGDPTPADWYANVLWIRGRKCLLVTHAGTLFSVFAPNVRAGELRPLADFVAPRIARQLRAEGFGEETLGDLDATQAIIAKTADRSVLGCMNDQAFLCEHAVADSGGLDWLDLDDLHYHLQRNILSARNYVPAVELVAGWGASTPVDDPLSDAVAERG